MINQQTSEHDGRFWQNHWHVELRRDTKEEYNGVISIPVGRLEENVYFLVLNKETDFWPQVHKPKDIKKTN